MKENTLKKQIGKKKYKLLIFYNSIPICILHMHRGTISLERRKSYDFFGVINLLISSIIDFGNDVGKS
jgi:hypothetical protein